jgi:hypothetical protein
VKGDKTVKGFIERLRKQGKEVYSYGKFCTVVYGENITLTEKFLNLVVDAIKHRYKLEESKREIRKAFEGANSVDPNQFIRENIAVLRRFFDSGQPHRMKTERKKMRISAAMRIYEALGRKALPAVFKLTLPGKYLKSFRKSKMEQSS